MAAWLSAGCDVVLAILSIFTLYFLRLYVLDTRTLARTSLAQLEETGRPLIVMDEGATNYLFKNVGAGPALNLRWMSGRSQRASRPCWKDVLTPGGILNSEIDGFSFIFDGATEIVYESVQGTRYRSRFEMENMPESKFAVRTSFERVAPDSGRSKPPERQAMEQST